MGWKKDTFLDFQSEILAELPDYKIDLFNNQFDDWEGDENTQTVLDFPCILIEFVGGDWQHDGLRRYSPAYFFRIHIGIEDYQESFTGEAAQDAALDHLDVIETVANILDLINLTFVRELMLIREEIDVSRTNIIEHILDFSGYVQDCSLEEKRKPDTVKIEETEQIVTSNEDVINNFRINNK